MDLEEYFADIKYQGEIVRARVSPSPLAPTVPSGLARGDVPPLAGQRGVTTSPLIPTLIMGGRTATLHQGGGKYTKIEIDGKIEKRQISAGANERFAWMQSVVHCTHYIYGEGEKEYLDFDARPEVKFIQRDAIDQPNCAWIN